MPNVIKAERSGNQWAGSEIPKKKKRKDRENGKSEDVGNQLMMGKNLRFGNKGFKKKWKIPKTSGKAQQ